MFQSFNAWEREQVWGCKYLKWVIIKYYLDHFVQLQFWTWKKYFKSWLLNWMAKYLITSCFNCYVSPKVLPNLQFKSIVYQISPQIHVFSCKYHIFLHKEYLIIVPPTSCFKLCNHIRFTFLIVLCFMKHPGWDHLGGSWETLKSWKYSVFQ